MRRYQAARLTAKRAIRPQTSRILERRELLLARLQRHEFLQELRDLGPEQLVEWLVTPLEF